MVGPLSHPCPPRNITSHHFQADLAQALLARAAVAISYGGVFHRMGFPLPYFHAALVLCITGTASLLLDMHRQRLFKAVLLSQSGASTSTTQQHTSK